MGMPPMGLASRGFLREVSPGGLLGSAGPWGLHLRGLRSGILDAMTGNKQVQAPFGWVLVPRGNCVPIRETPEAAPDGVAIMPSGVARVSTLPPGASFSRSALGFRSGGPPTTGDPSWRGNLLHRLPPPD
ncbi:hypothetical protein GUJ93_ZPchr0005g14310 [Zizania palustris]|uniref:Uncharacterized protein n=1 Tax=Zizania palustris TaxID=103762 RepID=A0A8J5S5V2_ZIZPA|nr:hypothetical protein GUJ93_ZPchr0005g14310 [Zizania palustris]